MKQQNLIQNNKLIYNQRQAVKHNSSVSKYKREAADGNNTSKREKNNNNNNI